MYTIQDAENHIKRQYFKFRKAYEEETDIKNKLEFLRASSAYKECWHIIRLVIEEEGKEKR